MNRLLILSLIMMVSLSNAKAMGLDVCSEEVITDFEFVNFACYVTEENKNIISVWQNCKNQAQEFLKKYSANFRCEYSKKSEIAVEKIEGSRASFLNSTAQSMIESLQ